MITKAEAEKAYADLIQLRRSEVLVKDKANPGQIEFHHVLPRCCGGSDDQSNIVALYAREHFMAHVYLWAIHHDDEFHYKMVYALNQMIKGTVNGSRIELRDFILQSEEYQKAREEYGDLQALNMKTDKNPMYGKFWYYDPVTLICHPYLKGFEPVGWKHGKKPHIEVQKPAVLSEFDRLNQQQEFDLAFGNKANNRQVRRFLVATFGLHCFKCGETTKKIYIHNIDGNLQNLQISNYELLCKDCYFKSGNIGWQLKKQK